MLIIGHFNFGLTIAFFRRLRAHGIHLRRLIYLSKEEFKFLKLLKARFLKKRRRFSKRREARSFTAKKELLECPASEDLYQANGNGQLCYEPTNIGFAWDSALWRWRRVKEYHRDLRDMDGDNRVELRAVYELMHS